MKHKPVRKKQRKYDADFKKEVLRMIESGRSEGDRVYYKRKEVDTI